MDQVATRLENSWLSLVAETAGVSGATIARFTLISEEQHKRPVRVVVQIHNRFGEIVGATYWYGDGTDLREGALVDLGCDFGANVGSRVVFWIDEHGSTLPARRAIPTSRATSHLFNPNTGMKLMLRSGQEDFPEAA